MRIAVISDIHGNPHALRVVLGSIKKNKCDKIVCCGDIVGYGYDPQKCIDIVRENNIPCVMGNHDAGLVGTLSIDWFSATAKRQVLIHRGMVDEESKEWIRRLPYTIVEDVEGVKVAFAHGSYLMPQSFYYIDDIFSAATELDVIDRAGICILFVGHTHEGMAYTQKVSNQNHPDRVFLPSAYSYSGLHNRLPFKRFKYSMNESGSCTGIFNVGSVGYPRRQPFIEYSIFDSSEMSVEWIALKFCFLDYKEKMKNQNMQIPQWVEDMVETKTINRINDKWA